MFIWIKANIATVLIGTVLICILAAITVKAVKDCLKGNSPCGLGCEHCAMNCHGNKEDSER